MGTGPGPALRSIDLVNEVRVVDVPGTDPEGPASVTPRPEGPTRAETGTPAPADRRGRPEWADRPVLPDITGDERDVGWGDLPEPSDDDRYLREVPPHHGG